MRHPAHRILLLLFLALSFTASRAYADDRTEARNHYQAGVKFYAAGDYQSAAREFGAAQQLAPADANNYNLALCYDKLGDADAAIQFYREYLKRVPNTDKRAEVEASIARLDAAQKSLAAKKAEEQRKADEARKAEEARIAAEEARKADEAAKAKQAEEDAAKAKQAEEDAKADAALKAQRDAEEARKADEAKRGNAGAVVGTGTNPSVGAVVGGGSTGTPGSGQVVSTGDARLDRVQAIDINAIRDQRMGVRPPEVGGAGATGANPAGPPSAVGVGAAGTGVGEAAAPNNQQLTNGAAGTQTAAAPNNGPAPTSGTPLPTDKPKPETPVYKKWWFWAVVAVSAYVVIQVATTDSKSSSSGRELPPMLPLDHAAPAGGVPLFRF